jgi:hypothetical protein
MPCHISDGPQTPDDIPPYPDTDPDRAYDEERQRILDTTDQCSNCDGYGNEPQIDQRIYRPCQVCGGTGRVPK